MIRGFEQRMAEGESQAPGAPAGGGNDPIAAMLKMAEAVTALVEAQSAEKGETLKLAQVLADNASDSRAKLTTNKPKLSAETAVVFRDDLKAFKIYMNEHKQTRSSAWIKGARAIVTGKAKTCLLYTSPSPRDGLLSRMPSSA